MAVIYKVATPAVYYLSIVAALVVMSFSVASAQVVVGTGDGSAGNPIVLSGAGDITSYILQNKYVQLSGGGAFTIAIPQTSALPGNNLVASPTSVDPTLTKPNNNGFDAMQNPTINYTGIISGTGSVEVKSGFNPTKASTGSFFDGGVLVFNNNGQTWSLPGASGGTNASALIIDTNTTVAFSHVSGGPVAQNGPAFQASTTVDRNITNNGYLYTSQNSTYANINGSGVNVFAFDAGLGGTGGTGYTYSGQLFDFNSGFRLNHISQFSSSTILESTDITTFSVPNNQFLTNEINLKNSQIFAIGNYFFKQDLDWQVGGSGILNITGTLLPPSFNTNQLDLANPMVADLAQYSYGNGANQGFGRVIDIQNNATLVLGNGSPVIVNPLDSTGVTNNVAIQGNPANTLLSINNFGGQTGPQAEALGFDYSGVYHVNFNLNQNVGTNPDGSLRIDAPRNGVTFNLFVLDPNDPVFNPAGGATAPNHLILTVPAFFGGLTRIDNNAILQLGDGTQGNDTVKTITAPSGASITSRYNDSNGNGAIMTRGNIGALNLPSIITQSAGISYQIVNNGQIIVDNTVGARDTIATGTSPGASAGVAAFVFANELDNISGVGSLEQMGSLALTLGGNTTYSGPTDVAANSILYLKTISGTGATGLPNSALNLRGALATFDISQADASNMIAGLTGSAGSVVALGSRNLTVNSPTDTIFAGSITDGGVAGGSGGTLTKIGSGRLTLNGVNTYTGLTDVQAGSLAVGDLNNPGASVAGSAQVESGATLLGHGTIGGDLMNLGTVQPGGSIGTLTVAGNYTQAPGANLQIDVTPSAVSILSVAGIANLAGTATFNFAPGTYVDHTYTYLIASGGIVGRFSNLVYQGSVPVAPEAPSATYSANSAQLVVGNGTSVSPVTTPPVTTPPVTPPPVTTPPVTTPAPAPVAFVVRPGDEQLASEQNVQLAIVTDRATDTLLGRPASGGAIDPTACGASPTDPGRAIAPTGMQEGAQAVTALGTALCPLGGWVQGSGTLTSVSGDGATSGFHGGTAGFLGGIDRTIGPYGTLLGIAVGDDQSSLHDDAGGSAATNTVRAGFYGAQQVGRVTVSATMMYGYDTATTNRETGVGKAYESHRGSVINGGTQAGLPMEVGGFALAPAVGVRVARIDQGAFAETPGSTAAGFAVAGAPSRFDSILPYVRLGIARVIALADGAILTPSAQVGYAYQAGTYTHAVQLAAQDGTLFDSNAARLGRSQPAFAAGLTYRKRDLALFANYAANVGGNWRSQTFLGGLRGAF